MRTRWALAVVGAGCGALESRPLTDARTRQEQRADVSESADFPCPGPPADALVFGATAYTATLKYQLDDPVWKTTILRAYAYNSDTADCGYGMGSDFYPDRVEGSLYSRWDVTFPLSYPLDYVGLYENLDGASSGYYPGFDMDIAYILDGTPVVHSTNSEDSWPGYFSFCVSHIDHTRIAGSVLSVNGMGLQPGPPVWMSFDFRLMPTSGEVTDGSCLWIDYAGATEEEIWDPKWWEARR